MVPTYVIIDIAIFITIVNSNFVNITLIIMAMIGILD